MSKHYDILILGSGPIAAATAYFLAERGVQKVGIVTQDPTDDHSATYTNAGGSVRWFWDDPLKTEMTKKTADFIKDLLAKGVELAALEDNYLFLNRGKLVPSLNVAGAMLVKWLIAQARAKGIWVNEGQAVTKVERVGDDYVVTAGGEKYTATRVLLALGVANTDFMPGYELEHEDRQLFILDLPIDDDSKDFPHTIIPVGEGVAYVFIKHTPSGLRFLVGQEDVVETPDDLSDASVFDALLKAGLQEIMPFLGKAKVEKVLWGVDAGNKTLKLESSDNRLFAANCGSAIRSCIYIGQRVADKLTTP